MAEVDGHLKTRDRVFLEEAFPIKTRDRVFLEEAFPKAFCKLLEKGWARSMAKSFYPLASVPKEAQSASKMEAWAKQFLLGVDFFGKMHPMEDSFTFVSDLLRMIENSYETVHLKKIQEKLENIKARLDKNPKSCTEDEVQFITKSIGLFGQKSASLEAETKLLNELVWSQYLTHPFGIGHEERT